MKKVYLLLLSLVVLMIALTGCGKDTDSAKDNSKPITLRYSTMQNKDHISYQVLQSSDMSIAEVAEMVGIKSASHFSKIFENEVGESPSKFRKSYFDRNHS